MSIILKIHPECLSWIIKYLFKFGNKKLKDINIEMSKNCTLYS